MKFYEHPILDEFDGSCNEKRTSMLAKFTKFLFVDIGSWGDVVFAVIHIAYLHIFKNIV